MISFEDSPIKRDFMKMLIRAVRGGGLRKMVCIASVGFMVLGCVSDGGNTTGYEGARGNGAWAPFEQVNPMARVGDTAGEAIYGRVPIMSRGLANAQQLTDFVLARHRQVGEWEVRLIAESYIQEAAIEGVNHDIAFCQMCQETNFLQYGGDVRSGQFNFCGLGATGGGVRGFTFENMQTGIRAHIQHLKAYGSTEPLRQPVVDPRFNLVRRGRASMIPDLTQAWATDPEYGDKIIKIMKRLTENHLH